MWRWLKEKSLGLASFCLLVQKPELVIYEQFRNRKNKNGFQSNGGFLVPNCLQLQKSLLPPLEETKMRNLAEALCRDIRRRNPEVKWESIKDLQTAKRLLKEVVVMPIKYPKYFTSLLSPWKGILLFGPPGTGKLLPFPYFRGNINFLVLCSCVMHQQLRYWSSFTKTNTRFKPLRKVAHRSFSVAFVPFSFSPNFHLLPNFRIVILIRPRILLTHVFERISSSDLKVSFTGGFQLYLLFFVLQFSLQFKLIF